MDSLQCQLQNVLDDIMWFSLSYLSKITQKCISKDQTQWEKSGLTDILQKYTSV